MKPHPIVARVARGYPFTAFGTVTLAGCLLLWPASVLAENRIGVFISALGLVLLAASAVATRLARAPAPGSLSWARGGALHAGENPEAVRIACREWGLSSLFRIHLRVSGRLASSGHRLFRVAREYRISGTGEAFAGAFLPASGELALSGRFAVHDILGLARRSLGDEQSLVAPVRARRVAGMGIPVVSESARDDLRSLRRQDGEERFFVREYAPGDLARDVNWKALARIGSLLTRIPPESPREIPVVRLVVLPPIDSGSALSRARNLAQLEHIRFLVASFLESARKTFPEYGFCVQFPGESHQIGPNDDFGSFFDSLALLSLGSGDDSPGAGPMGARALVASIPERAWVIGCAEDPELAARRTLLLSQGTNLLVSRRAPFRFGRTRLEENSDTFEFRAFAGLPDALPLDPILPAAFARFFLELTGEARA